MTDNAPEDYAHAPGIGTAEDFVRHAKIFQDCGVDQIIMMQQAGKNSHGNICESLELFGEAVLPEFVGDREEREREKAEDLKPYIDAAIARKKPMPALKDDEIPVVYASSAKVRIN